MGFYISQVCSTPACGPEQQEQGHAGLALVQVGGTKLFLRLGYPQVDLRATSNSNQVDQYFSAL